MAVGKAAQTKPDPCSFVIFGVTGDLAHRLVIPALYNLAATISCRKNSAWSALPARACRAKNYADGLMKGLHQYATRAVDDAIAQRLLGCLTCIEADPKDPASFDAMSKQLDELEAAQQTGGKPAILSGNTAERFSADQPRARPHRLAGRKRFLAGVW